MSIWIEDMELPKECYQCQFSYVNSYNQRICSRLDRECCDQFYCGDNGRLEDCPIHELPSNHGDLIDRSLFIGDTDPIDRIWAVPAVIEAESHFSNRKGEEMDWKR